MRNYWITLYLVATVLLSVSAWFNYHDGGRADGVLMAVGAASFFGCAVVTWSMSK